MVSQEIGILKWLLMNVQLILKSVERQDGIIHVIATDESYEVVATFKLEISVKIRE